MVAGCGIKGASSLLSGQSGARDKDLCGPERTVTLFGKHGLFFERHVVVYIIDDSGYFNHRGAPQSKIANEEAIRPPW